MEAEDALTRPRDLALERRVPEHVVGVDDHADLRGIEALRQVVGLAERDDRRPLADHHRVERLDRQPHTALGGVGHEPLDARGDHRARAAQVAADRRAAHEHEHVGAERGRLVDRVAVVVVGAAPVGIGGGREEAAAAEARDAQAAVADAPGAGAEPGLRDSLPPRADERHAGAHAAVDGLGQRPLVDRDLVEAQAVERHGPHRTPATARSARMRATASSGSRRSRAASARRNSSDRWTIERALSSPPTIRK